MSARANRPRLEFLHFGEKVRDLGTPIWWGRRFRLPVRTMPEYKRKLPHFQPDDAYVFLMRWLKGSTARRANQILNRTGQPFWQDESYDHYLRDPSQIGRAAYYIEQNPVGAGLAPSAQDWPWSSAGWQAKPPAPPNLPNRRAEM